MIGAWLARRLGFVAYSDEAHEQTLADIAEQGDRIVGTCSTCGADMWLALTPKRVVCVCGEAIPPSFFAYAEGRRTPTLHDQHQPKGSTCTGS
jgi:hypothetical protein